MVHVLYCGYRKKFRVEYYKNECLFNKPGMENKKLENAVMVNDKMHTAIKFKMLFPN